MSQNLLEELELVAFDRDLKQLSLEILIGYHPKGFYMIPTYLQGFEEEAGYEKGGE